MTCLTSDEHQVILDLRIVVLAEQDVQSQLIGSAVNQFHVIHSVGMLFGSEKETIFANEFSVRTF